MDLPSELIRFNVTGFHATPMPHKGYRADAVGQCLLGYDCEKLSETQKIPRKCVGPALCGAYVELMWSLYKWTQLDSNQ